jgi:hypothetical protein
MAASSADGIPTARVQACTVVVPAADNSSYNIYMFGGSTSDNTEGSYNDMWILSLPSFKWIKIRNTASDSNDIPGARTSHTCSLVGKRQMTVVGGARDVAAHKQCNTRSVFVFDLTTLVWRNRYDPDEVAYELPKNITNVIGGNEFGNAVESRNRPESWTNAAVQDIFFGSDVSQTNASSTATSTPTSTSTSTPDGNTPPQESSTPTGAIVGGIAGGVAALAAIAFGLFFLRRRRRIAHSQVVESKDLHPSAQELNAGTPHELDPVEASVYELGGGYYARQADGVPEYTALNELDAYVPSSRTESTVDGVERFVAGANPSPTTKKSEGA